MSNLKINFENANVKEKDIMSYAREVELIHNELQEKANEKDEFLGWLELPKNYDKKEFEKIKKCAKEIRREVRYSSCYRNWRVVFGGSCCN